MASFLNMLIGVLYVLLDVAGWIIVIQFILSILIAFNVINLYNDTVAGIWNGLNRLTEPFYRPLRRILPDTRPLDFAPLVAIVIIRILSSVVLPWLQGVIVQLPF